MIDWLTVTLEHDHEPIPAGRVIGVDPDGSISWDVPSAMMITGSYSDRMFFKSQGALVNGLATELHISGNPAKFLQGHNVFGPECAALLLRGVLERVKLRGVDLGDVSERALLSGRVARVDFTRSIEFPSRLDCRIYISQVSVRGRTRSGRGVAQGWTVTFQKGSRRWSFVVYGKGDELEKHKISEHLQGGRVERVADKLVRCELRLKTLELEKLGLRTVAACTPERLGAIYDDYVSERVEMSDQVELPNDLIKSMPRCARDTYLLHRQGIGVADLMTRTTFYRHARILRGYGIDIMVPFDASAVGDVVPIRRILTGQRFQVPAWAYSEGYIYQAA